MLRLFVGLALPDGVIARLNIMCSGIPGARWVEPANMHLTLRFIGEVDEPTPRRRSTMACARSTPALPSGTDRPRHFRQSHQPAYFVGRGCAVAGADPSPGQSGIGGRARGSAAEERKFTPHVTLARMTRPDPQRLQHFIEGNGLFRAGPFAVDRFTLFESRTGKGGAVYTELADYPLTP